MHHVIRSYPAHGRTVSVLAPGTYDIHFLSIEIAHHRPPEKSRRAKMRRAGNRPDAGVPRHLGDHTTDQFAIGQSRSSAPIVTSSPKTKGCSDLLGYSQ